MQNSFPQNLVFIIQQTLSQEKLTVYNLNNNLSKKA